MNVTHQPYQDTKDLAALLVGNTIAKGGATVGRYGEETPTVGYIVGGKTTTLNLPLTAKQAHIELEVARWIERQPTLVKWLGGWVSDRRIIFDTCDVLESRIEAEALGVARKQEAIYYIAAQRDIVL